MTSGVFFMALESKLVRIQEKGQVTLPAAVRKQLGLERVILVAVVATPEGVLITPQEVVASKALDEIGAILREQGLSLEELIEAGRDGRDELVREQYGIEPASQSE
jgi:AbrB family looped-hinge helix DNA binding protein